MKMKPATLADTLEATRDPAALLAEVAAAYPNLHSRRNMIYKTRQELLARNLRDDSYADAIRAQDAALTAESSGSTADLRRIVTLRDFCRCDVKRQLMVQKKIATDPHTDVCDPRDRAFYTGLRILPSWVEAFSMSREEAKQCVRKSNDNLMRRSSEVVRIEDVAGLVRRCRDILKTSERTEELAVAVGLCTGRRLIEVMKTGSFKEVAGDKYRAIFSGQAKDGLRSIAAVNRNVSREYTIPLLAKRVDVDRALALVRASPPSARRLSRAVQTIVHHDATFHFLRRLYARITFEVFKPHRYSPSAWTALVLGHDAVFISAYYMCIQISGLGNLRRASTREDHELYMTPSHPPPGDRRDSESLAGPKPT